MIELNKDYIPFARVVESSLKDKGFVQGVSNPFKRMVGSKKEVIDPIATTYTNTFNIIKNNINKIIRIDNDELCYDLINLYQKDGIISELAGTLPISALRHLDKNKIKHKKAYTSGNAK